MLFVSGHPDTAPGTAPFRSWYAALVAAFGEPVTPDRSHADRLDATYGVTDGYATPLRVVSPYNHVHDPHSVRHYLTVLLASEEVVARFDGIEGAEDVGSLTKDIWTREPVGASDRAVERAVAEVSD